MGVSDRAYMNDLEEAARGPRRLTAVATLLIINIAVWVLWQLAATNESLQHFMYANFTVSWDGLTQWRLHTLFTSAVSHMNIEHILWNMLFFWAIADEAEQVYEYRNMFVLYFFAGCLASLAHVGIDVLRVSDASSVSRQFVQADGFRSMLGASGAIMGVAVVAAFYNPNRPISLIFVTIPLKWLVTGYILIDLFSSLDGASAISHSAHLGGALGGYLFYTFDLRLFGTSGRPNAGLWNSFTRLFRRKPKLRVIERQITEDLPPQPVAKPQRVHARASANTPAVQPVKDLSHVDPETSRRVDELLGKISREGIAALTQEERDFLKASSLKYRR